MSLKIKNLHVKIADQEILKGVSLVISPGKTYALMGPNGCGKSSLARVLAGDAEFKVSNGQVYLKNQNILDLKPEQRVRLGIFLAFQNPIEVPGVNVLEFLRAIDSKKRSVDKLQLALEPILVDLSMKKSFLERNLNHGFSGGEKKKLEILQMAILKPKLIILDEIDSGLDVDSLKAVVKVIRKYKPQSAALFLITHYPRILKFFKIDKVHVMVNGKIIKTGSRELAEKIEKQGYQNLIC